MNFEYAKITRSRLMGSMGLVIKHSDNESEIFEYYLLDCEGLGFCDYVRLENPTKEEAYMEEERLMGGLGENRVFISEEEVHDQQGVGIGLYLAREIVTRQGGYIKVVSELRQGSEFSIMLPVR